MNYTQELSNDQIRKSTPSAFALTPYHGQSNRYAFIPTSQIIDGMRGAGFIPVEAHQSRTRIADKHDFTKHMIRFRPTGSLTQTAVVGESIVEAVLVNSHDGSSRYKLFGGVYTFTCSNGMMVADSMLEAISIKHTGNVIEEVIEGTTHLIEAAPIVVDAIRNWKTLTLAPAEQKVFAEAAHTLRFEVDEETGTTHTAVTPEMLLQPRRREDNKPDLWNTFNRIQENSIKGVKAWGDRGNGEGFGRITSRAVKGIDGDVRLNRALWSLAEKMAELKGA